VGISTWEWNLLNYMTQARYISRERRQRIENTICSWDKKEVICVPDTTFVCRHFTQLAVVPLFEKPNTISPLLRNRLSHLVFILTKRPATTRERCQCFGTSKDKRPWRVAVYILNRVLFPSRDIEAVLSSTVFLAGHRH
jgi:hypothetical protein